MREPAAATSLRAMTLNLWAQHGDWPTRRAALRDGLRELRRGHRRGARSRAAGAAAGGEPRAILAVGAEMERELQTLAVVRRIQELVSGDPAHVMVGGDFNAEPTASSVRFWTGRQSLDGTSTAYRDCWESVHGDDPGPTFDLRNPLTRHDEPDLNRGRRIDYLLVGCHGHGPTLGIADCRLALDGPLDGAMASDHYGVVADLEVHPRS